MPFLFLQIPAGWKSCLLRIILSEHSLSQSWNHTHLGDILKCLYICNGYTRFFMPPFHYWVFFPVFGPGIES